MSRDLAIVLASSLLATFNPSLLAAVTIMLLLPQRKRLMLGYLLGAYTTSIIAGLAIIFALHQSGVITSSQRAASPGERLALGALALAIAIALITHRDEPLRSWQQRRKDRKPRPAQAKAPFQERMLNKGSASITFLLGAALSFPGVTYVNALHHIANLGAPSVMILALVLYFCIMQQMLLELPLLACLLAPDWTQATVIRSRAWLGSHSRQIGEITLATLGTYLIIRGLPIH